MLNNIMTDGEGLGFMPEFCSEDAVADDEVKLLQVGRRSGLQPRIVRVGRVFVLLQLALYLIAHLALPLQRQGHQLVSKMVPKNNDILKFFGIK
jgi:hypothetical protein